MEAEAARMEEEHSSMQKQVEALNAELHQLTEDGKKQHAMNVNELKAAEKHAADMKTTLELERRRHEAEIAKSAGGLETGKMQVDKLKKTIEMVQKEYDKKCAELERSKQETKLQKEQADKVPPLEREVRKMKEMKETLAAREQEIEEFVKQKEKQQLLDMERLSKEAKDFEYRRDLEQRCKELEEKVNDLTEKARKDRMERKAADAKLAERERKAQELKDKMAQLNSEHEAANQDRQNMGDDMDSLQRLFDETVKSHRTEQEQLYLTIQVLQNRIHELENAPTEEVDNNKSFARFVELKDQNRSLKNEVKKLEKTKEEIAAGAQKKLKNVMQRKRMMSKGGMAGAVAGIMQEGGAMVPFDAVTNPADRPPVGPGPRQSGSFRNVAAMVEARNQPQPPYAEPTVSSPRIEKTLSMNQGNQVVAARRSRERSGSAGRRAAY